MKNRSGEKIKLTSIDELLGVVNEESAMEIEIEKIHPFAGHQFKVIDDEKMQDLIESIRENGVLTPVLIRPDDHDGYEMISGHRRMHAAQLAGLVTIPAIVREMTDDDAVIAMVDANIQREELLLSEKAFAYKMKMDAMKRQGCRSDLTFRQNGTRFRTDVVLAEQTGESARNIQRFIRLTELIPDLLEMVDTKRLNFTIAVDISYIPKDVQKWIYEYICDNGLVLTWKMTATTLECLICMWERRYKKKSSTLFPDTGVTSWYRKHYQTQRKSLRKGRMKEKCRNKYRNRKDRRQNHSTEGRR